MDTVRSIQSEKLKQLRSRLARTSDEAECQRIVRMIEAKEAKMLEEK